MYFKTTLHKYKWESELGNGDRHLNNTLEPLKKNMLKKWLKYGNAKCYKYGNSKCY